MKFVSSLTMLGAATGAMAAQGHNHMHRHVVERGSPVEKRAAQVTETVPATATVWQLQNGKDLTYEEVQQGIKEGKYVVVADETPAPSAVVVPSTTAVPTSSAIPTSTSIAEGEFVEIKSSSSTPSTTVVPTTSSVAPTTSSVSVAPTTSSTPSTFSTPISTSVVPSSTVQPVTSAKPSSIVSSVVSTATGISEDFPSGTLSCSELPEAYGAVYLEWLALEGWSGIQLTPEYSVGDSSIGSISEVNAGSGGCQANSFCSYACPEGYQKSQWPKAQGSLGQSVGGLYCNADGKLELSNEDFSTICIQGTGAITVVNNLSEQVAICRTDYPGYEAETIPLVATAGGTHQLTCPDASNYYTWEGSETSAQYYVNPKGYSEDVACVWGSSGSNLGNWAPLNLGVGKDTLGQTYISLIPNTPTNPDGILDFNVAIKGDISGTCSYSGGKYYDDSGENTDGCTVSKDDICFWGLS